MAAPQATAAGHAAAMDRMYRYTRHVYDLTRRPYLLGRDAMLAALDPPAGATLLEVGCGTGRNLVRAAELYPGLRLYGFDISAEMLKTAQASVKSAALGDRIALAEGDAASFDPRSAFGIDRFDRVIFSFTLSMIPDWTGALRHGLALTDPRGSLAAVDFGGCERLPAAARAGLSAWLALFGVTPRLGLEAEMHRLATAEGRDLRFTRPLRGYAQHGVIGPVRVD